MKILYFTATGNSLHIAKSFGAEIYSIPQMIKEGISEFTDDKIGIVFPVYSWAVAPYVVDFLKKATFNCKYLFAVSTYGFYDGAVTTHLSSIGNEAGYSFNYINRVKMVDNYISGFDMKKQIENEHKKQIPKQLNAIIADVEQSKEWKVHDSSIDKFATKMILKLPHKSPHQRFTIEDSCTSCGICTKVCPVNNISISDETGKVTVHDNCMMCFACTQNCPSNAMRFKGERSKDRFRNKNVSLQEIIKSNS